MLYDPGDGFQDGFSAWSNDKAIRIDQKCKGSCAASSGSRSNNAAESSRSCQVVQRTTPGAMQEEIIRNCVSKSAPFKVSFKPAWRVLSLLSNRSAGRSAAVIIRCPTHPLVIRQWCV